MRNALKCLELMMNLRKALKGSNDGCFFLDAKENLMNVAVSRAEDSFLVFGNVNCLKDEEKSPSGLLKKYVFDYNI